MSSLHGKATFGLIGAGNISRNQHIPNLIRARHIDFKTVCDLDANIIKDIQELYPIPHATTDYRQLLEDDEIQAVVIGTKEDIQAQLTIEALKAGKHVYVEKPLANTVEECQAVVEAENETGKWACVGFNRRCAPAYLKAKELLDLDGGPKNMYYRISDEYWRWGSSFTPGTRVIHELCHIFDVLRWLTGMEVQSIYCVQARPNDEAYILKFNGDCVAMIMDSGNVTLDLPKERLEAVSNRGAVTVEEFVELRTFGYKDAQAVYRFAGATHPQSEFTHRYLFEKLGAEAVYALRKMLWEGRNRLEEHPDLESEDSQELKRWVEGGFRTPNYMGNKGWLDAVEHLAVSILEGKTPLLARAEDGMKAAALAHAAIESRSSGQIVNIEDFLPQRA